MKAVKKILIAVCIIVLADVLLTGINIVQKGCGGYKGQTMEQVLGVPTEKATIDDISRLSRSQVMQLFYAAPAPAMTDLDGEYRAVMVGGGVLTYLSDFYSAHLFGPGAWTGKAFLPKEQRGYNLFRHETNGTEVFKRVREMKTSIAKSAYDGKDSFHVDYTESMGFAPMRPHDEIRKINKTLFLGLGSLPASAGTLNPMPFLVYGEATPWVGPDKK